MCLEQIWSLRCSIPLVINYYFWNVNMILDRRSCWLIMGKVKKKAVFLESGLENISTEGALSESILYLIWFSCKIQLEYSNTSYYFWLLWTTEPILRWVDAGLNVWLPESLSFSHGRSMKPLSSEYCWLCPNVLGHIYCSPLVVDHLKNLLRKTCLRNNHSYSSNFVFSKFP